MGETASAAGADASRKMAQNPPMNAHAILTARMTAVVVLALLAGCGTAPQAVKGPEFVPDAADEVFSVGFSSIASRYIEPVTMEGLVLDGLRGFGAIDPALMISREDNVIAVVANGQTVAAKSAPASDDARAWGKLISDLTTATRAHSPDLRAADAEKIYEAIFDGVLSRLDVYSRYAGAEEATNNRARRDGYGGIGLRFREADGEVHVTSVLPDGPAALVGIETNDRITHINDLPVAGMDSAEISRHLRGPVHSRVTLAILRDGAAKPLRFALERAHIVPPTVTAQVENGVLLLKISNFNQDTAHAVETQVLKTKKEMGRHFNGLVLDLRGNPGGLLKQSTRIADLFLAQGQIVSAQGRHPDSVQSHEATGTDIIGGRPIAVLIDGKSASAAEIVAAALQDRDRAVVIGTSSYGKGTVQTVIRLPNDGEITLTWSRLVSPSGYVLHGLGVAPTLCTSGLMAGDARTVTRALARKGKSAVTLAAWRGAGLADESTRKTLRAACPPEADKSPAIDTALAQRLIKDQALYRRTLAEVSATAQAQR